MRPLNDHFTKSDDLDKPNILQSTSVFFKSAVYVYLHVLVDPQYRDLFRFVWKGLHYRWKTMPFGLSTASRIFTMLLRPVLRMLRDINVSVIAYLDDLLIVGSTKEECLSNLRKTMDLLVKLGGIGRLNEEVININCHIYRDCKVTPARFQSVNAVFSDSVPIQSTNNERKVTIESENQQPLEKSIMKKILADSGADINIIPKAALTMEQLKSRKESNVMLWKTNSVTWFNSFGTPVIKSIPVG
ncbi:hypothetical protein ACTFIR_005706 [Dictyostelium discoideum]